MTIKRKLLLSNILMVAIPIAAYAGCILLAFLVVFIVDKTSDISPFPPVLIDIFTEYAWHIAIMWAVLLLTLTSIIFITLRLLTGMMLKTIIKPLDVLSVAAQEIQKNNLQHRISYDEVDEFKNVCDTFNKMAQQLYQMTTEREHTEESRKTLIAGISHDLRTPLTAIRVYVEGLEIGVAANPEQKEKYLATIKNKVDDMEYIINRLFLFSKLDIGIFPLNKQIVDLDSTLSKVTHDLFDEYTKKSLCIKYEKMNETVFVSVDTIMFQNALINIIENSVQYKNKELAELRILTKCVNGMAEISLSDNGPGIAPEQKDKLFDVFFRSDPSRNTKGSGLGLAISSKIIRSMGGTIHAETAEEGGLALVIRLPIVSESTMEKYNGR